MRCAPARSVSCKDWRIHGTSLPTVRVRPASINTRDPRAHSARPLLNPRTTVSTSGRSSMSQYICYFRFRCQGKKSGTGTPNETASARSHPPGAAGPITAQPPPFRQEAGPPATRNRERRNCRISCILPTFRARPIKSKAFKIGLPMTKTGGSLFPVLALRVLGKGGLPAPQRKKRMGYGGENSDLWS